MLEMAVCAEYRIFHSQFLELEQSDRDKAIWWHIRNRETCAGCGTRDQDWDETLGGNRHAFGAEIYRCRGCEVKEMAESADLSVYGRGIRIRMRRNVNPYAD